MFVYSQFNIKFPRFVQNSISHFLQNAFSLITYLYAKSTPFSLTSYKIIIVFLVLPRRQETRSSDYKAGLFSAFFSEVITNPTYITTKVRTNLKQTLNIFFNAVCCVVRKRDLLIIDTQLVLCISLFFWLAENIFTKPRFRKNRYRKKTGCVCDLNLIAFSSLVDSPL